MKPSENEPAIIRFKGAAVRYGRAIESGRRADATKAAREGRAARDILLEGERDSAELLELLDDPDPWVRYATAVSIIDAYPERATSVLRELQAFSGVIGVVAFTALQMLDTRSR